MDLEAALEAVDELEQEAALADSRHADDRREAGETLLDDRVAEGDELFELGFATDERRLGSQPRAGLILYRHDLPDLHGFRLPLRLDGLRGPEGERVPCREVGRPADEDAVSRRRRLDPCRGVEHVPRRRPLALARTRAEHHECLAGVDANPDVQVEPFVLGVQFVEPLPDRQPCANRALGVVLVRLRRAEQRKDGVAAELLEGSAV